MSPFGVISMDRRVAGMVVILCKRPRIAYPADHLAGLRLTGSWPQTLVLYRMRPTVSVQVSPGGPAGRVRYSGLKGAARGEALCKFNGPGGCERGSGNSYWSWKQQRQNCFG